MSRIIIVGGGKGGMALIPILLEDKEIKILGVADINRNAPALKLARKLGLQSSTNYKKLLSQVHSDVVINVTGSDEVSQDLHAMKKNDMEIIDGTSAKLLFKLVEERRQREEETKRSLEEQKALYDIGIMLTSSEKEDELLQMIVDEAIKLTKTPAGSIVLYNEVEGSMEMVAASGFSKGFSKKVTWSIRKGGLTEHIINEGSVIVINDLNRAKNLEDPTIVQEGIRALMAIPLISDRKTIGILYVDDRTPRDFSEKDQAIIALLATQAATAIEKMHVIELTKQMAITDELTGLYNHRHFVNLYKEEMSRAKRYKRSLSIMLIDVDSFKHYNDTHGHLKGNDVLKEVSEIMSRNIRDIDLLARYGGEEFSVILPETDIKKAHQCAERIRKAIEEHRFYGEKKQPLGTLTVSIGVSTYPEDAKRETMLLDRADVALYQAKAKGRNCVICYSNLG